MGMAMRMLETSQFASRIPERRIIIDLRENAIQSCGGRPQERSDRLPPRKIGNSEVGDIAEPMDDERSFPSSKNGDHNENAAARTEELEWLCNFVCTPHRKRIPAQIGQRRRSGFVCATCCHWSPWRSGTIIFGCKISWRTKSA